MGIAQELAFSPDTETGFIHCGISSAFIPQFTVVQVESGDMGASAAKFKFATQVGSTIESPAVPEIHRTTGMSTRLSVFPTSQPSDQSPLKATFRTSATPPKAKSRSSLDKPVTFHTKIRSSGYGSGPAPIPLGGRVRKKPTLKRKPSGNSTKVTRSIGIFFTDRRAYFSFSLLPF